MYVFNINYHHYNYLIMKFKIVQGTIEVKLNLIFEKTSATEALMKEELVESMNTVYRQIKAYLLTSAVNRTSTFTSLWWLNSSLSPPLETFELSTCHPVKPLLCQKCI